MNYTIGPLTPEQADHQLKMMFDVKRRAEKDNNRRTYYLSCLIISDLVKIVNKQVDLYVNRY